MNNRLKLLIISLIVLLGFFLRFYNLGQVPAALHRDEAFLGYNSYSLLKTSRDMNGNFLPLHLASFIYSPAGYSYLSIPFIMIFDLNSFSVRFASAFFGSLTILITFFLARELFYKFRSKIWLSLLSSFFLAISPWHINLSRTATENTVVVFSISLATLLYLIWIRKNSLYLLFLSFILFSLTLFIYQAPRAFLPFFIPLLIISFLAPKLAKKRMFLIVVLFLSTIIIPLLLIFSSKNLSLRIRTVSILAGSETQLTLDEQIREDGVEKTSNFITRIFHNKLIGYSNEVLSNYSKHFSYSFLFTDQGLPDRYRVPLFGLLYLFELPFLILGVWYLLSIDKKNLFFLIGWILLAPIGSSLTFDDVPNLQRTLIIFPALSIVSALGLLYILSKVNKDKLFGKIILGILPVIFIFSILSYLHQYYIHVNKYRPWYRNDGYEKLAKNVNSFKSSYEKVIVTNRESAPTIFFLFYNKYNPKAFQEETKNTTMQDFDRINFGKFEFSQEECPLKVDKNGLIVGEKDTLYVNSGLCKSFTQARELGIITRGDNSVVFRILDTR
ncbi:MAG: glycosyltransferase family 39 protein [Candidatus Levybacteria bacterium]|nr:glycosyltransferase family 39 protein [Candidatus Levybacteria bacterium]